jgi:hypothetical protein
MGVVKLPVVKAEGGTVKVPVKDSPPRIMDVLYEPKLPCVYAGSATVDAPQVRVMGTPTLPIPSQLGPSGGIEETEKEVLPEPPLT